MVKKIEGKSKEMVAGGKKEWAKEGKKKRGEMEILDKKAGMEGGGGERESWRKTEGKMRREEET